MCLRIRAVLALLALGALCSACGESAVSDAAPGEAPQVGVASCDQYLQEHAGCINTRVPEPDRPAMHAQLWGKARSWQRLAADSATRGGLAQLCASERQHAELALREIGCAGGVR